MTIDIDPLVREVHSRLKDGRVLIVGIDGFGGSGKSTLAALLVEQLGEGVTVALDDFILKEHMDDASWELGWDRQRVIDQVLAPLRSGQHAQPQRLRWDQDELSDPIPLKKSRLVLVEGLTSLHPALAGFYDFSVWVDAPIEISRQRGALRDAGNANESRWDRWAQNDLRYQLDHHPELVADLVVTNGD